MTEATTTAEAPPEQKHILTAIRAVMQQVRGVPKAGQMKSSPNAVQVQYTFQKYDDMAAAVGTAFRDHGVATQSSVISVEYHRWDKKNSQGGTTLWTSCAMTKRYLFTSLVDGSTIIVEACGEGSDSSDKATNKAHTSCLKNAYKEAFTLSTQDDGDPDAARPEITEHVRNQPTQEQRNEALQQDPWQAAQAAVVHPAEHLSNERMAAAMKGFEALSRCRTTGDALRITQWALASGLLSANINGQTLAAHILAARGTLRDGPPSQQQAHQTQRPAEYQPSERELAGAVRDLPNPMNPPDDYGNH